MSLQKYILDLQQFNRSLPDVLKQIISKHETEIVSLVKNRLYQFGVDGTGRKILPDYAPSTIQNKKERNKRTSHVTLREEGLFYKGFYLELEKYNLILNSSDFKTSFLIDKYSEAILEFTKQEKDYIINELIDPELNTIINSLAFNSSSAGGIDIL